ncbi:hypothetical protein RMN57_35505 [Kitasatospora sp. CM 4170]|uniref:Uncharacterized protein n=1 Tax=Kitasatospora aburaviensis TaxID=67265 RepID=A0ABW1EYE2_9ACTN|nr:hypothetical protein [Kitasatospora sp. CM 4170]WNM49630.1 hypothetical protein RMN57_35505 [Kitasatospora sp. CM 4170]
MTIQPLLDALDIQEAAAQALAGGLRTQIDELQARLRVLTEDDAGSFARRR